jgi:sigma-B regulation protein RsbU (phosphoserine phosphatase)
MPSITKEHARQQRTETVVIGLIWPLIALFAAFFVGFIKSEDDNAFRAALLFLCFSTIVYSPAESYPDGLREFAAFYRATTSAFLPYLFTRFFLTFPSPSVIEKKWPWLKYIYLAVTVVFWLIHTSHAVLLVRSFDLVSRFEPLFTFARSAWTPVSAVILITGLISLILNTIHANTNDERRRMKLLLSGVIATLIPLILINLYVIFFNAPRHSLSLWIIVAALLFTTLFPISFVYAVLRHRVFGIKVILRRGLQHLLVTRGLYIVEMILFLLILLFPARRFLSRFYGELGPVAFSLVGVLVWLAVFAVLRLGNRKLRPWIDRKFFRESYDMQNVLAELGGKVRELAAEPARLLDLVVTKVSDSLYPDCVAVFLRNSKSDAAPTIGPERSLVKRSSGSDFHCLSFKQRVEAAIQPFASPSSGLVLSFPGNGLVAAQLEKMKGAAPQAVEVLLDDADSWIFTAAKPDWDADSERKVLEHLNARLLVPLVASNGVMGFFSLGEKLSEEPYSKEDKQFLTAVVDQTAVALDYAKMIEQVAEQEKLKREIEIARQVQEQLFPQTIPEVPGLEYTGVCIPALGVGGDYYDFLLLETNALAIALGDISGKGISAALLMASLQALLRSHAPHRGAAVNELIQDINRLLCASTTPNKYATFFYGLFNPDSRSFTYVNAGHLPPMIFRNEEVIRLQSGGVVIGLLPQAVYRQESITLQQGDILVIFSDGVSEAMNEQEEEFGDERIIRIVKMNHELDVPAISEALVREIYQFAGKAPQHDDLTFVIAKITA